MFLSIRNHYDKVAAQLRLGGKIEKTSYAGNTVIVLVGNVTQVSVGAMSYANSLGNDVIAMHVSTEETKVKDAEVAEEFKRYFPHIRFENVMTSYRDIIQPTVEFVSKVAEGGQGKRQHRYSLSPSIYP